MWLWTVFLVSGSLYKFLDSDEKILQKGVMDDSNDVASFAFPMAKMCFSTLMIVV